MNTEPELPPEKIENCYFTEEDCELMDQVCRRILERAAAAEPPAPPAELQPDQATAGVMSAEKDARIDLEISR